MLWFLQLVSIQNLYAQRNNTTPTFNVDLTADPNGVWTSENVVRNGQLCGAPNNENCVQFNITLNSNSGGLQFLILSGPEPSGSMGYQIDCGPQIPVGQPICVNGTGPHVLTLCMPGNASGKFEIRSIPAFTPVDDISVTTGCSAELQAPTAFREETITWRDVSGQGYEKFLSFPNGKAKPVVTPDATAPAYVDYEVCGSSQTSSCATLPYCDIVRVFFYPPPVVIIGPDPAIICPGGSSVALLGNVTGGDGNFEYIWTNGSGNVVGNNLNYNATAVGTYKLEVRTSNYPNCQEFSASVNVVTNLTANAGPDQLVCYQNPVQLAGTVTAATGGIWSGGSGTFSDRTALNATYTPSAADVSAGSVRLTLTSTGNGSCSAVSDEVLINFYPMAVSLSGPNVVCGGSTASITATVTGGQGTLQYRWSTGETTASIHNKPAGTYSVTVTDGQSCAITKDITITEAAGPSSMVAAVKSSTCGNSNGEINITGVTGGTAPYTYSRNGTDFQSATTFTGLAAGTYTITVKDANGCTFASSFTLTNIAGPTAVAATMQPASCLNNDGSIVAGAVTGGKAPYTYSINGTNFQEETTFSGLAAGTYTLTAKDANQCTITTSVTITPNVPTNFTTTATSATCGSNNGEVTVTGVTGGTASYTYSKDGTNFQSSATLRNLLPGTHTITVKDAKGCTFSKQVQVNNIAGPTNLTASVTATTCGSSNGQITVTGVSGGTGTYSYSKNGVDFQASATFTGLAAGTHTITVKDGNGCTYAEAVAVGNVAGPEFTATATSSTCGSSNGSISVGTVTGGVGPYTYSKDGVVYQDSKTFSGLAAGTYIITAKDANGCLGTTTVEVGDIAGPTDVELQVFAPTCDQRNGYFRVTGVTGGTGEYMYARTGTPYQSFNTFGGLAPGEYTVFVKDKNGCIYSETLNIPDPNAPTDFAATVKAATCGGSNGEITVTETTGGAAPFRFSKDGGATYQDSKIFSGLAAGTYTITLKDRLECTVVREFVVNNIAGPTAVTASSQPATCANNDGTITAGAVTGGTAPYTYSINGTSFQSETVFAGVASGTYTLTAKDAKGCTVSTQVTVTKVTPTNFTASVTASTCGDSNGQFTITGVTGGTAPYTYSKDGTNFQTSSTFPALAAGSYRVTVKDANLCTYTKTVQVGNVAGPTFTATAESSTCGGNNGSISISNVSGGVAPYTYSKDGTNFQEPTTFSNLVAGTYTIVIKDHNGCRSSASVEVQDIAGPSAFELTFAAATCGNSNGRIEVGAISGGTAPYTYSLNNAAFHGNSTFTGLAVGEYTITVKDAKDCTVARKVTIENRPGPADLTVTNTSSTCGSANGKLEVTGVTSGTAPYSYSIDGTNFQETTTFANLAARDYTITVKDANGCTYAEGFTISNIAGPTAATATSQPATCANNDGTITAGAVTGGTAPYTYSINGTNFQSETVFAGVASGTYTLTAKDAKGCTVSTQVTVTKVTPTNFASTTVSATCGSNDGQITITGVTGGTAPYTYSKDGVNFQEAATFTALSAGSHSITVKDARGCTFSKQVQVNNISGPSDLVAAATASTCGNSNGQITVTGVTGGTASYTYALNGGAYQSSATFTALAAGTYTVSVKDRNGCVHTEEVVFTDQAAPTFVATAQSSTCGNSNGRITISDIEGGKAPFQFSKDGVNFQDATTFSGLAAGAYTITVKDANSCERTVSVELENIPGPTDFTVASSSSSCGRSNGAITASNVTGGTAPYAYSIDGSNFQDDAVFEAVRAGSYTVTVKDRNGCTISREITVTDVAGPTDLAASLTSSTCGGSNGALTITGVTGGTATYSYSIDGGSFQASATFSNLAAGQHTVTVKDANGCTFVKNFTIANIAGPTAVTASSRPATCADNDGTITAGTVTGGTAPYTYSINGTSLQSETVFAGVASGTYTLTAKDANGCTTSTEVTVGKNVPTSFTSTSTASTCGDSNGQFTITGVAGGTAPYTYSIDGENFRPTATFTALAAGVYAVSVKDANGCVYTDRVQLSDAAGPAFTATAQAATCGNSNGRVTASGVTGGVAPYTYSIDGENFQATGTFSNLAAGTYHITTKDANGCSTTKTVEVEDVAGPSDAELLASSSTCGNSTGQISISAVTGGTAPYSYSINGTNFQNAATFTALAAGEYTITVKDANGCIFEKQTVVENQDGPTNFTASTTPAYCGPNGELTVGEVAGGVAPYTYSKDGNSFQAATTFAGLAAGEYTITVKDANGCTFNKGFTITGVAGPSALAATSEAATCAGNDGSITVGEVTGGTAPYTYSLDGTNYQPGTTFTGLAAQEYQVYVKDANNCTTTTTVAVRSYGLQEAALAATPSGCTTSNGTITVTSVTGGTEPFAYSINGGAFQAAALFENLAVGSYTVTVKDAAGCTLTRTQEVTSTSGASSFTATTTGTSCGNADGSISISNISGGRSPYTFSIDGTTYQEQAMFTNLAAGSYQVFVKDAEGCVYMQETTINSGAPLADLQVKVMPAGCEQGNGQVLVENVTGGTAPYTYSLDGVNFSTSSTFTDVVPGLYELMVKDAGNCSITTSVEVEMVSSTLAHVKDETCFAAADGEIAITATGTSEETAYSINNGTSWQKEAVFTNLPKGVYQVITRFSATCSISLGTVEVKGPEEIRATVTVLTKTYGQENVGSASVTSVSGGVAPYTYKLDNGNFTTSTALNNLSGGTHTLLVKDASGCTTEVTFTIEAIDDIEVPNGFTPNGDGINDRWEIKNLSRLYPRCRVTVYNRWGSLVFESFGYNTEWDGTYNGKNLPDGTYYCIVELGDGRAPLKKSLTIMR
ncbi:hypothetical protein GCM10027443_09140 [Pontibacter brevis]